MIIPLRDMKGGGVASKQKTRFKAQGISGNRIIMAGQ